MQKKVIIFTAKRYGRKAKMRGLIGEGCKSKSKRNKRKNKSNKPGIIESSIKKIAVLPPVERNIALTELRVRLNRCGGRLSGHRMGGSPYSISGPTSNQCTIKDPSGNTISISNKEVTGNAEPGDTKASIKAEFKRLENQALRDLERQRAKHATTIEAYIVDNRRTKKLRDLLNELKDINEDMVAHLTNGLKVLIAEGILIIPTEGLVYGKKFLHLLQEYAAKHNIELPEISEDAFCKGMRYVKKR